MRHCSTPYLRAALGLRAIVSGNTCFHLSAALMLDLHGAELVFGVLAAANDAERASNPDASPVPFIHAWVEHNNHVLAPTLIARTGGELLAIGRDVYYQANRVRQTWRLSHPVFSRVAHRYGFASALKHGANRAGSGDMILALLRAAGVRFALSDQQTVLPG